MPSVLNMLPAAVAQDGPSQIAGTVSVKHRPPLSKSEPLYVDVDWNSNVTLEVFGWSTGVVSYPQQGDEVLIAVDDARNMRVIWWSGAETTTHTSARAWKNASQVVVNHSQVTLDARSYDDGDNFDTATDHRYIAPVRGTYHVSGQVTTHVPSAGTMSAYVSVYQNGSEASRGQRRDDITTTGSRVGLTVSDTVRCEADDYLELWIFTSQSVSLDTPNITTDQSFDSFEGQDLLNYMSVAKILS